MEKNIPELYGSLVFNDRIMRNKLPKDMYKALRKTIQDAGFALLGQRVLPDAAWEAYYTPMEARIAALRPTADTDLAKILDEAEAEIALWRNYRHQFGYVLTVVRPE